MELAVLLAQDAEETKAKLAAVEAQCVAMRQCLERWVGSSAFEYMPEPGTLVYDTDAALATDAGKALLARLKKLELAKGLLVAMLEQMQELEKMVGDGRREPRWWDRVLEALTSDPWQATE